VAFTNEIILQMAAANLGETTTVASLATPTTKTEKLGVLFLEPTRDRFLAKHNWSFATKRLPLTDITATEPREGWTHAYDLPADLLRVVEIDLGYRAGPPPTGFDPVHPTLPGARWAIETAGGKRILLCDIEGASLVYVARITDYALWDPDAVEAFIWMLSAKLAMPLSTSPEIAKLAETMARQTLAEAIADDANEARPDPVRDSEIIAARSW
jgi:hypothetical protein